MVFCNAKAKDPNGVFASHNPYFNRWFSAIPNEIEMLGYSSMSQSLF